MDRVPADGAFSRRQEPAPATVLAMFEAQVSRTPTAVAVCDQAVLVRYGELDARADQLCQRLRRLGAGPESLVGLRTGRAIDAVVAMLGVWKAQAAWLPLDPALPQERIEWMAEDSGLELIVAAPEHAHEGLGRTLVLDEQAATANVERGRRPGPGQLAYVMHTSGSTGRPKGVEIEHRGVANLCHWFTEAFALRPGDITTWAAPIGFDASVLEVWPALTCGARLEIVRDEDRLDPVRLRDWLVDRAVTVSHLVTPVAEGLLSVAWPARVPLRYLLMGGDRLRRAVGRELPFAVVNNYGPTEVTVLATSGVVVPGEARLPSIGAPLPNQHVHLLDRDMEPVREDELGELYVGGAGLARGYRGRPDLTAERFRPDPFPTEPGARLYRTGDVARLDARGFEFAGRVDDQVKVRGHRVEPGEVEFVLKQCAGVEDAVVVARQVEGAAQLVAYVVAGLLWTHLSDVRAALRRRLPDTMVPGAWVVLDELPRLPNGKIDRRALPEPAGDDACREYVAPRTAAERLVAQVWREVLLLPRVGALDDFFQIGGHSFTATEVTTLLHESLGIVVPLRWLFEHPTVAALAGRLEVEQRARTPADAIRGR